MGSTRSTGSSRARRVALAAGAGLVLLGTAGCSDESAIGRLGYPEPVTEQGPILLSFWQDSWVAAWLVGALTWGLIFWAIIAYRRRTNEGAPVQTRYNLPLEILYTVTPTIMIAALFVVTARDQAELTKLTDNAKPIGVVGYKWNWAFNYPEGAYDVGTPARPADLYLPVGEKIRFKLTSPDVIHSFWVPQFLFKMDVIPGRQNEFELTPNKEGVFAGKCAELCGTDHSRMLFNVHVVSQAEYDQHIADLKAAGQDGQLETGRIVTTGVPAGR
ncbi:MAG: cytochrome c oxidase subunit II [Actinobacteria bacterium]|nr:cytochrome c oxidase subunit II [Actinomycetota bacterium]